VARSCVCVAMSSLSLSKSLSISLSLGVQACVSGGGDALLAGADENSWQSRPRHACASSAFTSSFHTPSSRLHAPCAIQQQATVMVLEPCGDLLTELLSPGGRKSLMLRMPDKVSETAAGLSA
jgi:hypothetical protein